jgi:hypothetical protein
VVNLPPPIFERKKTQTKMNPTKTIHVSIAPRTSDPQGRGSFTMTYKDSFGNDVRHPLDIIRDTRGQAIVLQFSPNHNKGKYITGLEEEISNPWYNENGKSYLSGKNNWTDEQLASISKRQTITKQLWLEVKFDQVPGSLKSDLLTQSLRDSINAYKTRQPTIIESFELFIYPGKLNVFKDDSLRGALAIQLCENSKLVARSKDEIRPGTSKAYIALENEELEEKFRKEQLVDEAIASLTGIAKKNKGRDLYKIAVVLTHRTTGASLVSGEVSNEAVYGAVRAFINSTKKEQSENIRRYNSIAEMATTAAPRPRFEAMYALKQALNTGVFRADKGFIWWPSKSDLPQWHKLGQEQDVISFLTSEYEAFNPKKPDGPSNAWKELKEELLNKKIEIA